ncbi:MAG: hypothetical protein OXI96_11035, partial [Acidimicrobiaceae bacterium]|nr:hypothetical protein [Acidimicrobiaceae bacterium]
MSTAVAEFLASVSWRIKAAWMFAAAERWLPVAAVTALLLVLLSRLMLWEQLEFVALLVGVGTVVALIVGYATRAVGLEAAARSVDRQLATNDALATSLQFKDLPGVFGEKVRARADTVVRRSEVQAAVPLKIQYPPLVIAVLVSLLALYIAFFVTPAAGKVSISQIELEALEEETEKLREHIASIIEEEDPLSPDQAELVSQLEDLVSKLEETTDLDEGLAALDQTRSEIEASITDQYLSEKSAVQGLNQSLKNRPLVDGQADAASQLEQLADDLETQDQEALAERLEALADTQTAGNSAAADALKMASEALASGDLEQAKKALTEAASAQKAGEASVADQTTRSNSANALADSSSRLKGLRSQPGGQGQQPGGQGQQPGGQGQQPG